MDTMATDPRVEGWLFMSSLKPMLFILVCYSGLIYYGPQWMAKRTAFDVRYLVLIYDVTVAGLHLYMFFKLLNAVIRLQYNWLCEPVHYDGVSDDEMAIVANMHLFFICKLLEFLDTVFYILRKRENQLIAAHYFHHLMMVSCSYTQARWSPGGSLFFMPLTNSFIHFIVYINHGLTLVRSRLSQSLRWRKYMIIGTTIHTMSVFLHCLSAIIVGCATAKYSNYALLLCFLTYMILNLVNIRSAGLNLKISDLMRYSQKVNND